MNIDEASTSARSRRSSRRSAGEVVVPTDRPSACRMTTTTTPTTPSTGPCTKRAWTETKSETTPAKHNNNNNNNNKVEEADEDPTVKPPSAKRTRATKCCQPTTIDSTTAAAAQQDDDEDDENLTCCICMSSPSNRDLARVNECDHMFCFDCILTWSKRENSCPLCKRRFTQIVRVHPGTNTSSDDTVEVAPRNQEPPGTRLTLQGPDGIELVLWTPAGMPPHVVRAVRQAFSRRLARGEFTVQQTGGSLSFTELFTAPRGGARVRPPPANRNHTTTPGFTTISTPQLSSSSTSNTPLPPSSPSSGEQSSQDV